MSGRRVPKAAAAGVLAAAVLTGCDDQMKWVPWFSHMSEQPSVETYQEQPRPPVEGTVPVDGRRVYGLLDADTLLTNPLAGSSEDVARGERLYGQFCTPCHGTTGTGDGPVMMPQRERGVPFTPAMDLQSPESRARSDGYIWGIITEGRGLMPSYRRIPGDARWYIVSYVRHLQTEGEAGARPAASGERPDAQAAPGPPAAGEEATAAGEAAPGENDR